MELITKINSTKLFEDESSQNTLKIVETVLEILKESTVYIHLISSTTFGLVLRLLVVPYHSALNMIFTIFVFITAALLRFFVEIIAEGLEFFGLILTTVCVVLFRCVVEPIKILSNILAVLVRLLAEVIVKVLHGISWMISSSLHFLSLSYQIIHDYFS